MKSFLVTISFCLISQTNSIAQELVLNLNGFQIGQYREVIKKELGQPIQKDKYDDGFEYEIYLAKPDTSLYMIFEYSPINLEVIWSIQLTGKDFRTDFKGLSLGMDKAKVQKVLGEPSRKINVGEYGDKWEFDGTNFSVEINTNGRLSSIKITDDSYEMFPKVDVSKLPTYNYVSSILMSNSNSKIKEILCPDIEIYTTDSVYFFGFSMSEEVNSDKSGIFQLINSLSTDLDDVNTNDINEYEENVRLNRGQDPMHVIKIKKGRLIKEIVFKYRFGKYLIWEIRA